MLVHPEKGASMTIRSHYTAASLIKSGATAPADAKQDEGPPDNCKSEDTESVEHQSLAEPENTDLERRVLAHERILQALIAHMAESEPEFVERLDSVFGGPMRMSRREHDYTDTDAYADRFIRGIRRLDDPPEKVAAPRAPDAPRSADLDPVPYMVEQPEIVPTLLLLARRAGVWEVTKDGVFYGHYYEQQPAFDAMNAAARTIVANGGSADILLRGERPRRQSSIVPGPSDPVRPVV
ncbi:MAG: hypothetical protein OJF58_003915 [Enhydrobacter sp.]|jgi:hypothetical protein|nr:MAG: hypothetical protein OJF58_003915 [Enhydrobacter sp.]